MKTRCELFYSKLAQCPPELLRTPDVRRTIAKMARLIKKTDGRKECRHFLDLLTITNIMDSVIKF